MTPRTMAKGQKKSNKEIRKPKAEEKRVEPWRRSGRQALNR